jgi:hypothetical protein
MVVEEDAFLDNLGKAIRTFGTVGQCAGLIMQIRTFVERGLEGGVALKFQLGAKVVCVVLACLPFEMVEGEGKESLKTLKKGVDRVVGRSSPRAALCALLRVNYVLDRDVFGERGLGLSTSEMDEEGLLRLLERELQEEGKNLDAELVVELVSSLFFVFQLAFRIGNRLGRYSSKSPRGEEALLPSQEKRRKERAKEEKPTNGP